MNHRFILFVALASFAAAAHPGAMTATTCSEAATLPLSKAAVQSAEWIGSGQSIELWRGAPPTPTPIAFCRVRGVATPVPGSRIGFEVWLPEASQWNGKYLQAGNGGLAGAVPVPGLFDGLRRGYAVAGTDGGHESPDGLDASCCSTTAGAMPRFRRAAALPTISRWRRRLAIPATFTVCSWYRG